MTTEEDFQKALDADPNDHQTRLVFADWLQDRGDERAEGYRALGALRKGPLCDDKGSHYWYANERHYGPFSGTLPPDWFDRVDLEGKCDRFTGTGYGNAGLLVGHRRRTADDAAALAFAELPFDRRTELLAAAFA